METIIVIISIIGIALMYVGMNERQKLKKLRFDITHGKTGMLVTFFEEHDRLIGQIVSYDIEEDTVLLENQFRHLKEVPLEDVYLL